MREEYFGPVGFSKEPTEERKRWAGRFVTLIFIVLIALLGYYKVWRAPSDNGGVVTPTTTQTELPGPK
jgi:hypothetical protein